jgi:YVTN family beta-propeller protein
MSIGLLCSVVLALGPAQSAPAEGALTERVPLQGAPAQVAPATGTLLVLNKTDDTLWLMDPGSGARRAELPTGRGPHEVAVSPDGRVAVVADYGEQTPGYTLTVVDLPKGAVTATLDLSPHQRPHGVAFLSDGRYVAVTSEASSALLLVELATGKVVAELPTAQAVSHMVALAPDGARAYTANIGSGSLTALDLRERTRLSVVPTGMGAEGIDVTPDGAWVLVANRAADTLSFVDAATLKEAAELPCGRFPIRVKVTPDGKRALVSCATSGEVAVIDLAERKEVARIAMAHAEDTESADAAPGAGPMPIGILIPPDGTRAYVANTNADLVTVLDLASNAVAARLKTGRQPDGLGWTPLVVPEP